jgi:hypothetical protein
MMTAPRHGNEAHIVGFVAALVAIAGCFLLRFDEGRIATVTSANEAVVLETERETTRLREQPRIDGALRALRGRTARLAIHDDPSSLIARFLADAGSICSRRHTRISSISATSTRADAAAAPARDPHLLFEELPLDVTIEGRYVDVLATIGDLGQGRVIAAIDLASIARAGAPSTADVAASVHVTLERIALPLTAHAHAQRS